MLFEKKPIEIPRDMCPLDVIAEMGEKAEGCGIFLSNSVMRKLIKSEGSIMENHDGDVVMIWSATDKHPETKIVVRKSSFTDWNLIIRIEAEDICFKKIPPDPEKLVFLTMGKTNFPWNGIA